MPQSGSYLVVVCGKKMQLQSSAQARTKARRV